MNAILQATPDVLTFSTRELERFAAAAQPFSRALAMLEIVRLAAHADDGLDEGVAEVVRSSLDGIYEELGKLADSLHEIPGFDFMRGHSMVSCIELAIWNAHGLVAKGPLPSARVVAAIDFALLHLERVAAWLANSKGQAS
jgi:hypothetical protein